VLAAVFPRGFSYPFAAIAAWFALALVHRGLSLRSGRRR